MQRLIADIEQELTDRPARSAWDKGVKLYAQELFADLASRCGYDSALLDKITEKDLMNGADNWEQYSYGGCSLIYDGDICERLCTEKEAKRKKYGECKPGLYDDWLDAQAAALKQAARIVVRTVNRRD